MFFEQCWLNYQNWRSYTVTWKQIPTESIFLKIWPLHSATFWATGKSGSGSYISKTRPFHARHRTYDYIINLTSKNYDKNIVHVKKVFGLELVKFYLLESEKNNFKETSIEWLLFHIKVFYWPYNILIFRFFFQKCNITYSINEFSYGVNKWNVGLNFTYYLLFKIFKSIDLFHKKARKTTPKIFKGAGIWINFPHIQWLQYSVVVESARKLHFFNCLRST